MHSGLSLSDGWKGEGRVYEGGGNGEKCVFGRSRKGIEGWWQPWMEVVRRKVLLEKERICMCGWMGGGCKSTQLYATG